MRVSKRLYMATAMIAALALGTELNAAVLTAGPGDNNTTGTDSGGTRLNLDLTNPIVGSVSNAGSYAISNFLFRYGTAAGDAQPIVAQLTGGTAGTGGATYTIRAVGQDVNVAAPAFGTLVSNQANSSNDFVIANGATYYVGFTSLSNANVTTDGTGGGNFGSNDVHLVNGGAVAVSDTVTLNATNGQAGTTTGTTTAGTGASYNLARKYDFAVTVTSVPEPASLGVLGLGSLGLLAFRRRRM